MPTGVGLIAEVIGVVLVVLGVVIASLADDLLFVVTALFLQYLGEVLVLTVASGPSAGATAFVLGAGSLAILSAGEALRPGPIGHSSPRAFDLSVVALAVAGAVGLAVTHPVFPNLPADVAIAILVLAGLLFCLLGGAARTVCGLIFLTSGIGLLLQLAEPGLGFGDRVLLAACQLSLVLALSVLWTIGGDPVVPRPHRRRFRPDSPSDHAGSDAGWGSVS